MLTTNASPTFSLRFGGSFEPSVAALTASSTVFGMVNVVEIAISGPSNMPAGDSHRFAFGSESGLSFHPCGRLAVTGTSSTTSDVGFVSVVLQSICFLPAHASRVPPTTKMKRCLFMRPTVAPPPIKGASNPDQFGLASPASRAGGG